MLQILGEAMESYMTHSTNVSLFLGNNTLKCGCDFYRVQVSLFLNEVYSLKWWRNSRFQIWCFGVKIKYWPFNKILTKGNITEWVYLFGRVTFLPYFVNALSQNNYFWFVFNAFYIWLKRKSIKRIYLRNGRLWYLNYELFFLNIYRWNFFITTSEFSVILNLGLTMA